jgi:hypothetical protein
VSLQKIPPTATPAGTIPSPHDSGPLLTRSAAPEGLSGAAIHVVRVVLAGMQTREGSGLRFAPLARLRTSGTVPVSVLASFVEGPAYLARELMSPRIGQRLVDRIQNALVFANGPDVFTQVLASLKVGTEGAARFGHHARMRLPATPAAVIFACRVLPTPLAVLYDHKCILRIFASVTL